MKKSLLLAFAAAVAFSTASAEAFEGNAQKGERLFLRCKACHNLTAADRARLGPNLNSLFGRQVASEENFKYSKAMQEADFVWTDEKLDAWLTNPKGFLPGNRMAFPGLKKPQDRADLIAYLKEATAE